jgi:hypothetical protein
LPILHKATARLACALLLQLVPRDMAHAAERLRMTVSTRSLFGTDAPARMRLRCATRTPLYKLKRKLMAAVHGIVIEEIL